MNKRRYLLVIGLLVYVCYLGAVRTLPLSRRRWMNSSAIDWVKCDEFIECGRLEVPLSYSDPSAGVASLSLARYPATSRTEKRIGSLLINPGGPGASGVRSIYRSGRKYSELFDGRYDIVSWDPRGINGTTPRIHCFATQTEQDIYYAHSSQEAGLYLSNASDPQKRASFVNQLKLEWARDTALVELCINRTGREALNHMGTSTSARDLERLSSVLEGEETPVNFWGFSWGSILGSHFVNMFPDRVGRIAIDGVVNPVLWSHSHPLTWRKEDLANAEDVFTGFVDACTQAGSERCPIAPSSNNSMDLRNDIDALFEQLADTPLPVPNARRPGALTAGQLRDIMFGFMHWPTEWPELASLLQSLQSGNGAPLLDTVQSDIELDTTVPAKTTFALGAVQCADLVSGADIGSDGWLDATMHSVEEGLKVTPHFGSVAAPDVCPLWPIREADPFLGPFNNSALANHILVIGNTYDPITPLHHARAVHSMLKQSTLIQQDGYGHCSTAMASLCTARIIRDYFLNGTAPAEPEVVCRVTEPLFPAPATANDVRSWNTNTAYSAEDIRLLTIMQGLGANFEEFGPRARSKGRF